MYNLTFVRGTERAVAASNPSWTTTNAKRSEPKGWTLTNPL
jgi:hypothetical protein